MGHEPDRNDWLGNTLRSSPAASLDACPDAETLAAWTDGALKAQAATAVEAHASSCNRCMAVLAAMERTAPAVRLRHAWTPARLFRWLVPATAAATAIAIWVLVPNRPVTLPVAAPAEESQAGGARSDADTSAQRVVPPGTQEAEPQAELELRLRDQFREGPPNEAMKSPAPPAALSAPPEQPPGPAASAGVASDSRAGAAAAQQFALRESVATSESVSPSNPLNQWRVVSSTAIERSTDGGKTWTKTVALPGMVPDRPAGQAIVNVRAVDDLRALATTADGTAFYTTDGGQSWARVQENSPAPF